jgi:excisionase family DNA binding protein
VTELLTLRQAASYIGLHYNTLQRWAAAGTVPAYKYGRRGDWRFRTSELDRWMEAHRNGAARDLGYGTTPSKPPAPIALDSHGNPIALTDRQVEALAAYAATSSQKDAGRRLGVGAGAIHARLHELYARLGVEDALEAMRVLGWLRVPEEWAP